MAKKFTLTERIAASIVEENDLSCEGLYKRVCLIYGPYVDPEELFARLILSSGVQYLVMLRVIKLSPETLGTIVWNMDEYSESMRNAYDRWRGGRTGKEELRGLAAVGITESIFKQLDVEAFVAAQAKS